MTIAIGSRGENLQSLAIRKNLNSDKDGMAANCSGNLVKIKDDLNYRDPEIPLTCSVQHGNIKNLNEMQGVWLDDETLIPDQDPFDEAMQLVGDSLGSQTFAPETNVDHQDVNLLKYNT